MISKSVVLTVAMSLIGLFFVGCADRKGEDVVRIGAKNFTEQLILGELMAQVIEANTNVKVDRVFNLGGTMICHTGLKSGDLDVYAEYTGTALTALLNKEVISDADESYAVVDKAYSEQFQCDWLKPFGFDNTYAITTRDKFAKKHNLETISDLAKIADQMEAGFTAEFMERADGYTGLKEAYGFEFKKTTDMDPSLMYRAVADGNVDFICAFATDGRIAAYDLKKLKDNKGFFPPYLAAPVIRREVAEKYPQVVKALESLGGVIDDAAMQNMNYKVDEKKMEPENVAKHFLMEKELI